MFYRINKTSRSDVLVVSGLFLLLLLLSHLSLPPSPPPGLIISLQLLRGDMEQVRRENPLIFSRGVAITRKLGFPDVIMPGESTMIFLPVVLFFKRGGSLFRKLSYVCYI